MKRLIHQVEQLLKEPLPGQEAHKEMAPFYKPKSSAFPVDAKQAGVLIFLYPKKEEWHFALIQRALHEKDKHSGQISFPGGSYEPEDIHLSNTALREAEEEIGIKVSSTKMLGPLTPLYIPVSNFLVHPYVAYTMDTPSFKPDAAEVQKVLEIHVDEMTNETNFKLSDIHVRGNILKKTPTFELDGHVVWGATAMMLNEWKHLLNKI